MPATAQRIAQDSPGVKEILPYIALDVTTLFTYTLTTWSRIFL
jgi:hypothetical protein